MLLMNHRHNREKHHQQGGKGKCFLKRMPQLVFLYNAVKRS